MLVLEGYSRQCLHVVNEKTHEAGVSMCGRFLISYDEGARKLHTVT